ncbi:branched-chain-amino-acid aminotransferase-like protein 2 [Acanthaster planci]|uniref:Branched-chain-amino-acid aminotransferase-like protein 2 n=1 Tax=Acanthaster planci TaxID=133434 RepID=A0A8B7XWK4_ACAPL|nr:branched-chain-amino-acid aminotransferase-like protein 2 [Acanthaster planci]
MADLTPQQHRIFCWSTSRCLSTVFMKCLSMTEGALAWLEPFSTAEHYGPQGRLLPPGVVPKEPDYKHAWVKQKLEGDFEGHSLVFVKDLAYAVTERLQFLPNGYRHSFLIRHPLKSFMSFYRLLKKTFGESEVDFQGWLPQKGFGYGELAELADYVERDLRQPLVIVDADDIQRQPKVMVEKYCRALGLPFSESILTWEPGIPKNWILRKAITEAGDYSPFIATMVNSHSFIRSSCQTTISQEEVPQVVKEMVEVALPFYEKLHARRLLPS